MEKHHQFSLWYFVLALAALFAAHALVSAPQIETLDYSDFKKLVKEHGVVEVEIGTAILSGKVRSQALATLLPAEKAARLERDKDGLRRFATVRVDDPNLAAELEAAGVRFAGRYENTWLKSVLGWVVPIILFLLIWSFLLKRITAGAGGLMSIGRSKAKVYVEKSTGVTFKDVAGIEEAKAELEEVVLFLRSPERFRRLGGKIPKGVLLVGPPGTGKTLLAKAVAGEASVPFFSLSGSEFVEMFVGVGAARVRDLFQQAQTKAPCIIFIDELDALGKVRALNPMGGHDERDQTLNQLLVEMDGFSTEAGVIILAATNRPEILDPALLRPGRFDRHVLVDRPDLLGRQQILEVHAQPITLGPDVDFRALAGITPGFVGADLANVVNEAALLAARKEKPAVAMADFEEAIERIVAGLEKKSRRLNEQEKRTVAYHESGHALAASAVRHADPVQKVSIIPRGIAALGYTLQRPTEDRFLMSKSELLDKLAVLLGGRCAEEIVFNEISTGAQNDLQRATDLARSMVAEYGMSEHLGIVTYERQRSPFLPVDGWGTTRQEYSEETARAIDAEVRELLDTAHLRVLDLLRKRRELLDTMAEHLLQYEDISGAELQAILKKSRALGEGDGHEPAA
ncbi:MAG: ATP-dependent zinc metalloprotease FtsH [Candidatus Tectomicrobia bacterium]|nr:ATP-dependent zinc metalloprotease FtsH [Candidatus Tectomicrobia bacterium]